MNTKPQQDWKAYKLDQLGSVGRGRSRHRPRNDPALYGGDYPFFQTGDVKEAELYLSRYSQTYNDVGLAQSKLWKPGTLCITIAANIAETAVLTVPGCFPDSVVGFVACPDKANTKFIKYYIDTIKLGMQNVSRGTTQDNLSLDKLLTFDFIVPCLSIQNRVAAILSAYDDLIANNTRRITILEEMARALYREWFVHFRFPGHEQVPLMVTEIGLVPDGWQLGALENALLLQRGFDLPTKQRQAGDVPVYASTGINGTHNEAKVKGPGVVTGRSGSLGTVLYVDRDYWPLNTTLYVKEFRRVTPAYAFFLLRGLGLESFNSGAAVPTLNRNDVHKLPVRIPPREIQEAFDRFVLPLFSLARNLDKENGLLRQARDKLLPKLLSGEIPVDSLETAECSSVM